MVWDKIVMQLLSRGTPWLVYASDVWYIPWYATRSIEPREFENHYIERQNIEITWISVYDNCQTYRENVSSEMLATFYTLSNI